MGGERFHRIVFTGETIDPGQRHSMGRQQPHLLVAVVRPHATAVGLLRRRLQRAAAVPRRHVRPERIVLGRGSGAFCSSQSPCGD